MTATLKTVRALISSTLRDMHAERDHLVTVVFPELRPPSLRLQRGRRAHRAVGAGVLRRGPFTLRICDCGLRIVEQWIDRVEPFFVCILGQRYGLVPEPEQLKAREDRQRQQVEQRSITDMEVRHAVLNTKLKRRSYFCPKTGVEC